MLQVSEFSGGYRPGISVVDDISIEVGSCPVTSIVGSNGAGKTSLLRGVCGLLPWHTGMIRFHGERIDDLSAHEIARIGIRMVPSGRGTFGTMTVVENLQIGGYGLTTTEAFRCIEREFARFPRLNERKDQRAGMLSGGEQQMLAIARAMMSNPQLLILDEPSQGLAPIVVDAIFEMIPQLVAQSVQVLLVEQDVGRGLEVSQYAFVVEKGRLSASGDSKTIAQDPRIREAYLGLS